MVPIGFGAEFAGGTGEPDDPYQIATAAQLMAIDDDPNLLDKCYILVDDIDLDPNLPGRRVFTWAVIAPDKTPYTRFDSLEFNGRFDGNGHVVHNLTIVSDSFPWGAFLGLFGRIEAQAEIFDLGLENVHIEGAEEGEYIGALVGEASHVKRPPGSSDETFGDIRDCYSSGTVSGKRRVGGLVGYASRTVRNCYSTASVQGSDRVGGLAGYAETVVFCYSTGSVSGEEQVGGLVGRASTVTDCHGCGTVDGANQVGGLAGDVGNLRACSSSATVSGIVLVGGMAGRASQAVIDCNSTGVVTGSAEVGGLVGSSTNRIDTCRSGAAVTGVTHVGGLAGKALMEIVCSHSTGTVSGQERVGGLAGSAGGDVRRCYSTGTVGGETDVGGLIGLSTAIVMSSYSTGTVDGIERIGGLAGTNLGSVTNSFSTATVLGSSAVGGLVGSHLGDLSASYSAGAVEGTERVGGLIGDSDDGTITRSFWDMETSGRTSSQGGLGLSTAEMQARETFSEAYWDLVGEAANGTAETWWMPDSGAYPRLRVFGDYEPPALSGQGTAADPYRISNALELGALGFYSRAHFRLEADIDLTGSVWRQAAIPVFEGVLDGNDYAVRHLQIEGGGRLGLFGAVRDGAEVRRLHVQEVIIEGRGDFVGALAGRNDGSLDRCISSGSVAGSSAVGGLVGLNECGITDCRSTVEVHGKAAVGGLVGDNRNVIRDSIGSGAVSGELKVGGLVGNNLGGFIDGCKQTGLVRGQRHVGGLVGSSHAGDVRYCFNTGSIMGVDCVGGVVGSNTFADVHYCYNTESVEGEDTVGGLIGENRGDQLYQCYSSGPVSGIRSVGGLVGNNLLCDIGDRCAEDSFWDIDRSGVAQSLVGVGRTTLQMQDVGNYLAAGWDFANELSNGNNETWQMSAETGYPVLTRFIGYDPMKSGGQGTVDDPFLITTAHELACLDFHPAAHFRLEVDIDLAPYIWARSPVDAFQGSLDGNGHVVRNFHMEAEYSGGFVGWLRKGGCIRDLGLTNLSVSAKNGEVGGLVRVNSAGMIVNCYTQGSVSGARGVGGLVGYNRLGSITGCFSTCVVQGDKYVGGLAGESEQGSIRDCYSAGAVTGVEVTGGLVGLLCVEGRVTHCYSTGWVAGTDAATGGLIGSNETGVVADSFWDIDTSGTFLSDGGAGLSTRAMTLRDSFTGAGWDFENTWSICEGTDTPRLQWEQRDCP
jgi:hypothetical protein